MMSFIEEVFSEVIKEEGEWLKKNVLDWNEKYVSKI